MKKIVVNVQTGEQSIEDFTPEEIIANQEAYDIWQAEQASTYNSRQKSSRSEAYRSESDPLFFKWQRGEATEKEWKDKVIEIQSRYPYEGSN